MLSYKHVSVSAITTHVVLSPQRTRSVTTTHTVMRFLLTLKESVPPQPANAKRSIARIVVQCKWSKLARVCKKIYDHRMCSFCKQDPTWPCPSCKKSFCCEGPGNCVLSCDMCETNIICSECEEANDRTFQCGLCRLYLYQRRGLWKT